MLSNFLSSKSNKAKDIIATSNAQWSKARMTVSNQMTWNCWKNCPDFPVSFQSEIDLPIPFSESRKDIEEVCNYLKAQLKSSEGKITERWYEKYWVWALSRISKKELRQCNQHRCYSISGFIAVKDVGRSKESIKTALINYFMKLVILIKQSEQSWAVWWSRAVSRVSPTISKAQEEKINKKRAWSKSLLWWKCSLSLKRR